MKFDICDEQQDIEGGGKENCSIVEGFPSTG